MFGWKHNPSNFPEIFLEGLGTTIETSTTTFGFTTEIRIGILFNESPQPSFPTRLREKSRSKAQKLSVLEYRERFQLQIYVHIMYKMHIMYILYMCICPIKFIAGFHK